MFSKCTVSVFKISDASSNPKNARQKNQNFLQVISPIGRLKVSLNTALGVHKNRACHGWSRCNLIFLVIINHVHYIASVPAETVF